MTQTEDTTARMLLTSRRRLDAPPAAVWAAWADADRLSRWWGPNGFATTTRHFDFRAGGTWDYIMHGPDGHDFPGHRVFIEVTEPLRIVARHEGSLHDFTMTVVLEAAGGGTEMTWELDFDPNPTNATLREVILAANEENFDRLEAHLAGTA